MGVFNRWFNVNRASSRCHEKDSVAEPVGGRTHNTPEREWENTQRELSDTLRLLQKNSRDMARSVRDFQERYIDGCELHCARCLIDVHRHLDGLYRSHGPFAVDSDNERYGQAVESLAELAHQVERDLASFGVIVYVTEPGTPYDPNIHIADPSDTVLPGMVVIRSLRPGFRSERLGERLQDDREMVHVGWATVETVRKDDDES